MFHTPQIGFKKSVNPQKRLSVWWKSRFLEHAASSPPCPRNWKSFVLFNLKSLLFFVPALQQLQPPFFAISLVSMSGLSNFLAFSICFVEDHFTFNLSFVSICSLFQNLPQKCHGRGCDGHDRHHEHQGVRRQQALSNQNIFEPKLFTPKLFQAAGP